MRTYLGRRPTLGQAQLEMILHSSEEVLETFGCTVQEALEEKLLNEGAQREKLSHRKHRLNQLFLTVVYKLQNQYLELLR